MIPSPKVTESRSVHGFGRSLLACTHGFYTSQQKQYNDRLQAAEEALALLVERSQNDQVRIARSSSAADVIFQSPHRTRDITEDVVDGISASVRSRPDRNRFNLPTSQSSTSAFPTRDIEITGLEHSRLHQSDRHDEEQSTHDRAWA